MNQKFCNILARHNFAILDLFAHEETNHMDCEMPSLPDTLWVLLATVNCCIALESTYSFTIFWYVLICDMYITWQKQFKPWEEPAGTSHIVVSWLQSQVESYPRLKKWYLILLCLALCIIRYGSRVKWSNPGKGVMPSLIYTPWCSSYWKGSLLVTLDDGCQLFLLTFMVYCFSQCVIWKLYRWICDVI